MRIKKLWIDSFKNLQNFEIEFNAKFLTSVLIGGNGTGKSNLLESIAVIFRDLDLELKNQDSLAFEYFITYECRGHNIEIDANPSQTRPHTITDSNSEEIKRRPRLRIKVDGESVSMRQFFVNKYQYLPKHVFGYYSGPSNRLAQRFDQHQKRFYDEQRQGEDSPLRPLFFALPVHSQFVLLAYFSFPEQEDVEFLKQYLGITGLESVLFVVKEPDWKRFDYPQDAFWGATGIPRQFLEDLFSVALAPIRESVKVPVRTGKTTDEEHLYLFIEDEKCLEKVAYKHESNREFFKALDTLYIADLIAEVRTRVRRVGLDGDITFTELSEGEQQLLTVLGLLKFTQDSESLFLLDEPDTHLNPQWKLEYMGLIEPIVGDDTQCQILQCTHDPIIISSCLKEQVRVFTYDGGDRSGQHTWFEPEEDPRGMGIAGLLTSEVFGLRTSLDVETQQDLDRKRELAAKDIDALSEDEKIELQHLTKKLSKLGFTYTERDPLYKEYVKAMTAELDEHPELQAPVLSKEQMELQSKLAREVLARLRSK